MVILASSPHHTPAPRLGIHNWGSDTLKGKNLKIGASGFCTFGSDLQGAENWIIFFNCTGNGHVTPGSPVVPVLCSLLSGASRPITTPSSKHLELHVATTLDISIPHGLELRHGKALQHNRICFHALGSRFPGVLHASEELYFHLVD